MRTTKQSKKILIINWKWRFDKKDPNWLHLNEKTLEKIDLTKGIESGKNVFYKEFRVKPSRECPDALVVATCIYNDNQTKAILYQLIDHYYQKDNELILLIHRPNQYKEDDIQEILHKYDRLHNCALFEGGRDYIYYPAQESGLLDDLGNFFVGYRNDRLIETIDEQEVVQQPYFDRVWNYYVGEFENKVLVFKEELFDVLFPFLLPDAPDKISRQKIINILQKDIDTSNKKKKNQSKLLWYRLKSFLGRYKGVDLYDSENFDVKADEREEVAFLKDLEKINKTSYLFDASLVNIQEKINELETGAYTEVKKICDDLFFDEKKPIITKSELRLLADKLDFLTMVIPGLIP